MKLRMPTRLEALDFLCMYTFPVIWAIVKLVVTVVIFIPFLLFGLGFWLVAIVVAILSLPVWIAGIMEDPFDPFEATANVFGPLLEAWREL